MSFFEINNIIQTIRALILGGIYFFWAKSALAMGRLDAEIGLVLLGKSILFYAGVTILAGIILHILAMIVAIARGEEPRAGEMDERDRIIEFRATRTGFALSGFGFMAAAVTLWFGYGAVFAFFTLLAGFIAADVLVNMQKFITYWRQSS
ncbi:MAG: hypothetical protein ABI459_02480 [Deltaproteobacteria bacterium]